MSLVNLIANMSIQEYPGLSLVEMKEAEIQACKFAERVPDLSTPEMKSKEKPESVVEVKNRKY